MDESSMRRCGVSGGAGTHTGLLPIHTGPSRSPSVDLRGSSLCDDGSVGVLGGVGSAVLSPVSNAKRTRQNGICGREIRPSEEFIGLRSVRPR